MPLILARILTSLRAIGAWLVRSGVPANVFGFAVAAVIPAAYIAIWVGVLGVFWDSLAGVFQSHSVSVFGSFPSGSMWLLNQTLPVKLMFQLTVAAIMVRFTAAHLIIMAIGASRYLKGK